jgi:DNA repair exonuclease SbcCD ATPase subunit
MTTATDDQTDRLGVDPVRESEWAARLAAAEEERDRAKRDHEGACHLVAKMHHAATGITDGPRLGVVEDVADLRSRYLAAEARAEKAEEERDRAREYGEKWRRIRTPTHGTCCTCQACGLGYDECRCDLDEAVDRALAAETRAEKAERERDEARRAIESCTPGGSEYHNDPITCAIDIRKFRDAQHEMVKRSIARAKEAEARVAELEAALRLADEDDECPCCLTHSCRAFRVYVSRTRRALAPKEDKG